MHLLRAWLERRRHPLQELVACTHHVYDQGERAYAPHCDARVLHTPGECVFCDHYPDWQQHRLTAMIAFTGHEPPEYGVPCPADQVRGHGQAHKWHGNRPEPA